VKIGAHQAIGLSDDPADRVPDIIEENCVGCNLCSLICPVEKCLTMVRKDAGHEHLTWKERTVHDDVPTHFNDQRGGGVGHYVPEPKEAIAYRLKD